MRGGRAQSRRRVCKKRGAEERVEVKRERGAGRIRFKKGRLEIERAESVR